MSNLRSVSPEQARAVLAVFLMRIPSKPRKPPTPRQDLVDRGCNHAYWMQMHPEARVNGGRP